MLQTTCRKRGRYLLAAAAVVLGPAAGAGRAEPVVRVGETEVSAAQIQAEFAASPPALIETARYEDFTAHNLAINYYRTKLFAQAARDDGLLERKPGLALAAATQERLVLAAGYTTELLENEFAPSEPELRQLYNVDPSLCATGARIRLSRIAVKPPRRASEAERTAARARFERIRERLGAGEEFGAVADDASDLVERGGGGDLGWMPLEKIRATESGDTLLALPVGGRSGEIESSGAWVLYEVVARDDEGHLDFERCRPRLVEQISRTYVRDLRKRRFDELAERYGASLDIAAFTAAIRAIPAADAPNLPVPGVAAKP